MSQTNAYSERVRWFQFSAAAVRGYFVLRLAPAGNRPTAAPNYPSGIVAHEPIRQGANATTVNAAIEGFVRAAAIELPHGIRINAVSPTLLSESEVMYAPFFPGFAAVPGEKAAKAYVRSVEGAGGFIRSGEALTATSSLHEGGFAAVAKLPVSGGHAVPGIVGAGADSGVRRSQHRRGLLAE